jgi:uncharacterized repeat protein (TIGR03943 family)
VSLRPQRADGGERRAVSDRLPAAVVIALGAAALWIVHNGQFTWYVRSWQRWPLLVAGAVCIAAGVVVLLRRPATYAHGHGHAHGPLGWLAAALAVPVIVVAGLQPPPLGAAAALLREASAPPPPSDQLPPIPPWPDPYTLTLDDFTERALYDTTSTLRGRRVRLIGFVVRDPARPGGVLLSRWRIVCCAADAELIEVRLDTPKPLTYHPGTWIAASGTLAPVSPHATQATLHTDHVSEVPAPVRTYES